MLVFTLFWQDLMRIEDESKVGGIRLKKGGEKGRKKESSSPLSANSSAERQSRG